MPLTIDTSTPKFPTPEFLTLGNFRKGVITLIDKSRLPKDALEEANNIFLVEDGQPSIRPGIGWFGTALPDSRTTTFVQTTNLVTNPGFEVDTSDWGLQSGATISRVTTEFQTGVASLKVITTTTSGSGASISVAGLTPSTAYVASAYIKAPLGVSLTFQLDMFTAGPVYSRTLTTAITGTGAWQRVNLGVTLSGTETQVNIYPKTTGTATTFYVDSVMFEQGSAVTTYFDGSTTATRSTDYAWTGTAQNSTSTRKVYTMTTSTIDGYDYFDFGGVIHLVASGAGYIYRSTDNGTTWDACTGATLTPGATVKMNQNGNLLYITTGNDNIVLYDGSTTLVSYTALTTPAAATIARTGLAASNYTVYYKISAVNKIGFTLASPKVSQAVSITRDGWDATTNYLTLTLPSPQSTQTRYDIYYSDDDLTYYYLDSIVSSTAVPNVTYKDDGSAVVAPGTVAPTGNTTQGPKVAELTNVGSRQYGVRDPNNRYRIYFTGAAANAGSFSSAYNGGYLDWQPGGKYMPVKVEDYRDGKGTPLATVWCESADGQGCILQMSLDTLTVSAGLSVTVPSAYQLPGSRGTSAPGSVVNVLNDYMFYNSQAFFNLGSRAQFLNLLSTDEASANIRPTVRQISASAEQNICSVYSEAKVYFSIPLDSDTNNYTAVYDTERKCWLPKAFTVGFKQFLRYVDTTNTRRLLALKPGDNRLSEISTDIQGDYGVAFETSLLTGLYPTSKDRYEFQFTEEMEFEFSNPQGTTYVELLGYERTKGLGSIKTVPVEVSVVVVNSGWDTSTYDTDIWDDTSVVPTTVSESSLKRYSTVQKELNSVQWHVYSNTLDARYVLRSLQTWGTPTQAGHPGSWRVKSI